MATSIADMLTQLDTLAYNPAALQRAQLQTLSDVTNGAITIVDPSSPFIFALESAAVLTSYALSKNEVLNRKQYPFAAQDLEDLYLHMSDTDYVNRFAVPASYTFNMMLPYTELLNKLVLDTTTGIKKVVIPRNTNVTIANTVFSLQYPIEIRQLLHGGLQLVYDTSEPSPLQTLSTNLIPWQLVSDGTTTYLQFSFEMMQFGITSLTQTANASTLFSYQIGYSDEFYYARVYSQNTDGTWTEIQTTHTALIYDITTPTAVLEVLDDNILQVSIPQIYTATGILNSAIRIDIYTTQGAINVVFDNYQMALYVVEFVSYDKNDSTIFTAPLSTLSQVFAWATGTLNGGSNGVDFATLQQQVINNTVGPQVLPITNVQLQETLELDGYQVITNVDNITNRIFLATRALPDPVDSDLITAAGTANATVSFSLDAISGFSYVINNTDAMTITPDALYKDVNGVVSFVSDGEIAMLNSLPPDQRALVISAGGYLYTPFHYVLDSANSNFAVRPYYLDDPVILTKLFISDNDTTLLQVNTGAYGIVRTSTGYKVQIQTVSGATFQALNDDQVYVQLAFTPEGEKTQAFINGILIGKDSTGKERIYEFDLSSNMNVDAGNNIELTQFLMFTTEPRLTGAALTTNFDILYATTAVMDTQWVAAEVDAELGNFLLPASIVGITHEQLQIQFGNSLDTLWARARSVVSTILYETWTVDVPWTYQADVYQRDPVTGATVTIVDGQPTTTILHHKGDPVLDDNNAPVLQHAIGDIVLDANGAPIQSNPRGMTRQIDFMLIEGVYRFATDSSAATYRTQMIDTLLTWLTGDLESLNDQLLEQTQLFFYPKKTLGEIDVMIGASQKTTIQAGQSLTLTLYVDSSVYNNQDLRAQLSSTSVELVSTALESAQVSRTAILDTLTTAYGTDVIEADLTGLGSVVQNLPLFTILDDSIRASLRKKLVAQTDNSLILTEDLTIVFVQHDESVLSA